MKLLIGISALIIGVLMLTIQIKRYIDGHNFKKDSYTTQSANAQFTVLAIAIIIAAVIYLY